MSTTDLHEAQSAVADASRELAAAGAFIGTAGNLSTRVGDLVAITGTGVHLDRCRPEDVSVVTLEGRVAHGRLLPSSELSLHLDLYRADPGTAAVAHTHAPSSTALACVIDELPVIHYQQLALGGDVRVASYATFGTQELADAVASAMAGRQAALMRSHGSVAIGRSLQSAVDNVLLLEWLSTLYLRASQLGTPHVLTAAEQEAVILAALSRGYGTTHEIDPAPATPESGETP